MTASRSALRKASIACWKLWKCSRRSNPAASKYCSANLRRSGGGTAGKRNRTSIVSPYCKEMEARARILLAFERVAVPLPEPQQEGLNVLAGAQGVDGKVRARAVVLEQPRPAHGYPVNFPARGLHAIVAVRLPAWPFQNLGDGIARSLPPFGNLLLD